MNPQKNNLLCLILLFTTVVLSNPSHGATRETYATITSHFIELDKSLQTVAQKSAGIRDFNKNDNEFIFFSGAHSDVEYILRTNKDGKIVSKVTGSTLAPRTLKSIKKQQWYKIVELSKHPYYGNIISRNELHLFWVKPLIKRGKVVGTVAAKIDLRKSFQQIAEKRRLKFKVTYGKNLIFSNANNDENATPNVVKEELAVFGLSGVKVEYTPVVSKVKVPPVVKTPPSSTSPVVAQTDKSSSSPKNEKVTTTTQRKSSFPGTKSKDKKKKSRFDDKPEYLYAFIGLIAFGLFIIVILIVFAIKRKRINDKIASVNAELF